MTVKKLIEVALPLDAINKASAKEKTIRHGHPSTLHLWWARRPLAAARAVLFAQMVDDPSSHPELFPTEEDQERERQRLFRIIEELVVWENTNDNDVLNPARDEIWKSWRMTCAANRNHPRAKELFDPDRLPAFHDPFAGGGSLPLEAQRLGLEAYASDLNPVAVLINKAMIELPSRSAGRPPVNPESRKNRRLIDRTWQGAQGLADDVRYYGQWMRDEAENRIGHLYPSIEITTAMARDRPDLKRYLGQRLSVIAWLWARTVNSPNPAFMDVAVPLVANFMLSTKPGKETYVEPIIERGGYQFRVRVGKPSNPEVIEKGTKLARGANFRCIMSDAPLSADYIMAEGKAGHMGVRLMAIVADGVRGRVYLSPTPEHEAIAATARPAWRPETLMPENPRWFSPPLYGMRAFGDLFTPRQLFALTTFSNLVGEARERVLLDASMAPNSRGGEERMASAKDVQPYADSVATYLAFALSKAAMRNTTLCLWERPMDRLGGTFGRQALPMVWDYAETNPLAGAGGDLYGTVRSLCEVLDRFCATNSGSVHQADAATQSYSQDKIVSADPPYYDNIGYADLSDFFYVWLRRTLRSVYPDLFSTLSVPKAEELVALPSRHGGKGKAEAFFLDGMTRAMRRLAQQAHPGFPVTIYYAFKQTESASDSGAYSTGWETFLDAVLRAGFAISGTWPVRTEQLAGLKGSINALASSIILVCRRRLSAAPAVTRREFLSALRAELPAALRNLQRGNIAPVDLAQAAIGPGMAVFTRYAEVLDASGTAMTVREALTLINQTLDEVLTEQEGDLDADTRWALAWFEQSGFGEGEYGVAETLSKAKDTSVEAMAESGLLVSSRGKVRLLRPKDLDEDWTPGRERRPSVWKTVHYLVRDLDAGESAAAALVAELGGRAEPARDLAYRLYVISERKHRAQEALAYNALVQSWPEIARLAQERRGPAQNVLF